MKISATDLGIWASRVTRVGPDDFLCHIGVVEFVPFATGVGANVDPINDYIADPVTQQGYQFGIQRSAFISRVDRQGNWYSSLHAFIESLANSNADVLDDGDFNAALTLLWQTYLKTGYFEDFGLASALEVANPGGQTAFAAPSAGLCVTVKAANGCTGATTFNWMGNGPLAVTYSNGAALQSGDYAAGSLLDLRYSGTTWILMSVPFAGFIARTRIKLTVDTTFFVNWSTGNDSTGNGTSGAPWKTRQHARDYVQQNYDVAGFNVSFQCTGAFTDATILNGPFVGQKSGATETWIFTTGSTVATTNGICWTLLGDVDATFNTASGTSVVFSASGAGAAEGYQFSLSPGATARFLAVDFGSASKAHILQDADTLVLFTANYRISGAATAHVQVNSGASVARWSGGITITNVGTPAITTFLIGKLHANIQIAGVTFSGGITGNQGDIDGLSTLFINGAGTSYLPGTANTVSVAHGSQYY